MVSAYMGFPERPKNPGQIIPVILPESTVQGPELKLTDPGVVRYHR